MIYFCVKFQKDPLFGVNLTFFCTLVTMATAAIFQPLKSCHTLRWIFLQSFMKFDERNPILFLIPLFCFHGNCSKVCPTDSDFFDLSRSTRCGCCSYQVSSISVWWVTYYDHFCVFIFFSILAVPMATAAILEKSTLKGTTSYGMIFLQSFIKFDQGISEKCVGQTFDGRKEEEE